MPSETKHCNGCNEDLPRTAFRPRADRPGCVSALCRPCDGVRSNARRHKKIAERWEKEGRAGPPRRGAPRKDCLVCGGSKLHTYNSPIEERCPSVPAAKGKHRPSSSCEVCHGSMSHMPGEPAETWCPAFRAKFNFQQKKAAKQRTRQAAAYREIRDHIGEVANFIWSVIDGDPLPVPEWVGAYIEEPT